MRASWSIHLLVLLLLALVSRCGAFDRVVGCPLAPVVRVDCPNASLPQNSRHISKAGCLIRRPNLCFNYLFIYAHRFPGVGNVSLPVKNKKSLLLNAFYKVCY